MSVSLASRNAATGVSAPAPWRVVTSIARVEARRLFRNPIFLFGVVFSAVMLVSITWSRAPVLHQDDVFTAVALMPLAAVTLLIANAACLRGRRHGTEELYDTGPVARALLTAGQLLGVAGGATLVAVALVIAHVAYLKAIGGVWWPSTFELATGPAIVAFSGAVGVALARWVPSLVVAPLALVGLGALQASLPPNQVFGGRPELWLALWVPFERDVIAREAMIRPAGWHLLYLVGLVGLFAALALLRNASGRRVAVAAVVALAVICSSAGVLVRRPSETRVAAELAKLTPPERAQVCERHGPVTYCAFRAYAPLIARWAKAGNGVVEQLPPGTSSIEVRQLLYGIFLYSYEEDGQINPSILHGAALRPKNADAIAVGFSWGRGSTRGTAELMLTLGVAGAAVGLPPGPREYVSIYTQQDVDEYLRHFKLRGVEPPAPPPFSAGDRVVQDICTTGGQARAAVALWLAAQATPGASDAFRRLVQEVPYGIQVHPGRTLTGVVGESGWSYAGAGQYNLFENPFSVAHGVTFEREEATYAAALLARPRGEVAETIRRHWRVLTDPKTPTGELLRLFGLKHLPTLEEQIRAAGFDVDARVADLDGSFYSVPCR